MDSALRAHRAGVRVATRSDVDLNETTAEQVRMLIEAGLSPAEALQAGRRTAASVLDLGDEVGTVEVGKQAALILVDCDPLTEPLALDHVTDVLRAGPLVKVTGSPSPHPPQLPQPLSGAP